jgi:predicted nuclease with RNAse H fold
MRGAILAKRLAMRGFLVLETHPSSVARILGYRSTLELVKYIAGKELSRGAADSVAAAMVGFLFDKGEVVTCEGDPPLVLPLREARIDVS